MCPDTVEVQQVNSEGKSYIVYPVLSLTFGEPWGISHINLDSNVRPVLVPFLMTAASA